MDGMTQNANSQCKLTTRSTTGDVLGGSRGQGIIEMMMAVLIFVIMIAMVGSVSAYLYLQHNIITAAREGARVASLDPDLGGNNVATGTTAVKTAVQSFVQQTTGLSVADNEITVTAPSAGDPVGSRTVTVQINYHFNNPLALGQFLTALGASNASSLDTIPVVARAVMRYEE
jgi:hypothetical protein